VRFRLRGDFLSQKRKPHCGGGGRHAGAVLDGGIGLVWSMVAAAAAVVIVVLVPFMLEASAWWSMVAAAAAVVIVSCWCSPSWKHRLGEQGLLLLRQW
jgi:hypothetical protein